MNSIKVEYKVTTIYINSENSKTSYPYKPLLNLSDKINFKRNHKYVVLSNLTIHGKYEKFVENLKYQLQGGMMNLN